MGVPVAGSWATSLRPLGAVAYPSEGIKIGVDPRGRPRRTSPRGAIHSVSAPRRTSPTVGPAGRWATSDSFSTVCSPLAAGDRSGIAALPGAGAAVRRKCSGTNSGRPASIILVSHVATPHHRPMFVRLKRSGSPGAAREYLQIVESFREQGKVRQRLIATLGRRDELVATGALDDLIRSLTKFSERLRVVERVRHEGLQAHTARAWG